MTRADSTGLQPAAESPHLSKNTHAAEPRAWLPSILLITLCALWALNLKIPFSTMDDPYFITANRYVRQGLTWESFCWACTTRYGDYWHPVLWFSLMLDESVFGMNSWGFHLTNALFH